MAEELAAGGASKQARAQGGASFGTDDPRGRAAGHKPPLSALDSRRLYQIVQAGDLAELEEALAVVYSPDGGVPLPSPSLKLAFPSPRSKLTPVVPRTGRGWRVHASAPRASLPWGSDCALCCIV